MSRQLQRPARLGRSTGPVFQTVTGVNVVDPLTVQFTMNQPWSTFPHTLTTQPGAMAAPQGHARPAGRRRHHPVGTGPFTLRRAGRRTHR